MPNRPNGTGFLDESNKGAAQGVAPLDADKRVPLPNSPRDLAAFDVRNFGASPTATAAVNNAAFYAAVTAAGRRPVYIGDRYTVSLEFIDQHVNLKCYGGGALVHELGTKALDITNNVGAPTPVVVNAPSLFGPPLPSILSDTQVMTTFTVPGGNYADFEGGEIYHLESKDAYPWAAVENTLSDPANFNVWKAEWVTLQGIGIDITASTGSLQEGRTIVGVTSGATAMVDSVVQMTSPTTTRKALVRKITKGSGGQGFIVGESLKYNTLVVGTVDSIYLAMAGNVSGAYTTTPKLRKARRDLVTSLDIVVDTPTGQDTNAICGATLRNASRSVYLHGLIGAEVRGRALNGWTRFLVAQSCYLGSYEVRVDGLPNHALETEMAYGYGFEAHGSSSDFAVKVEAHRVRHGFTTNSSPATYATGNVLQWGTPKRIDVTGKVTHAFSAGFDTHAGAENILVHDTSVTQPMSGVRYLTTSASYNDRSHGTIFRNVTADGGRFAMSLGGMAFPAELPYTTRVEGLVARNIMHQGIRTSTAATVAGAAVSLVIEACDITMDGRAGNDPYYHNVYYFDANVAVTVHNSRSAGFNGAPGYVRNAKSIVVDGHRSDYSGYPSGPTGWRIESAIPSLSFHDYGITGGTSTNPEAVLRNVAGDNTYKLSGIVGAIDGTSPPTLRIDSGNTSITWLDRLGRIVTRPNQSYNYVAGTDNGTIQVYSDVIGNINNRTVTLPVTAAVAKDETVRIVRAATATGSATLTVVANAVNLKQLEIGTWVQVAYTGTAWIVVGAGTL